LIIRDGKDHLPSVIGHCHFAISSSRSDALSFAVGFSPRNRRVERTRRVATIEIFLPVSGVATRRAFSRDDVRELKPTAKIIRRYAPANHEGV
jgi:hypothetical protein